MTGYISKPIIGNRRGSGDRQFFYINNRPCDMPKIAKTINELFKSFVTFRYPTVVLNFKMDTDKYDVNVTPDKRVLMIHQEAELVAQVRDVLEKLFESFRGVVICNTTQSMLTFENEQDIDQDVEEVHPVSQKEIQSVIVIEDGQTEEINNIDMDIEGFLDEKLGYGLSSFPVKPPITSGRPKRNEMMVKSLDIIRLLTHLLILII